MHIQVGGEALADDDEDDDSVAGDQNPALNEDEEDDYGSVEDEEEEGDEEGGDEDEDDDDDDEEEQTHQEFLKTFYYVCLCYPKHREVTNWDRQKNLNLRKMKREIRLLKLVNLPLPLLLNLLL